MNTFGYYENDKCLYIFRLYKDRSIRTLGSAPDNDYVVKKENIADFHLKIQYQLNTFQISVIKGKELFTEEFTLPSDTWLDITKDKKFFFDKERVLGYLTFFAEVKTQQFKKKKRVRRTMQMSVKELKKTTRIEVQKKTQRETKRLRLDELQDIEPVKANLKKFSNGNVENPKELELAPDPVLDNSCIDIVTPSGQKRADKTDVVRPSIKKAQGSQETLMGTPPISKELDIAPDPALDNSCLDIKVTSMMRQQKREIFEEKEDEGAEIINGRYRVISTLGKGGMGLVYRVFDKKLKREVALKLLSEKTKEAIERFSREAKAIANLSHPNVVKVYDIDSYDGQPFFTMDLIEGKDLNKVENLRPRQSMRWMLSICDAIQYIHSNGIIHRDLKPSNIIISKENRPILMDFGIAKDEKQESKLTMEGQSLGTPAYMSPEQARGQTEDIDEQTDIYGLGSILYEMLTGQPPFDGPPMQVLYKVCTVDPVSIQTIAPIIPKDITVIAQKAMAKEKNLRFKSASEMAEDIKRYLDGLRIHSKPIAFHKKIYILIKRNKLIQRVSLGFLAFFVILILFLNYKAYSKQREREKKIKEMLLEASLKRESLDEEYSNLKKYIEIFNLYTKILLIDSQNEEAKKGKFELAFKIGNKALRKKEYYFAKAMYMIALRMNYDNMKARKFLDDVKEIEQEEKRDIKNKVDTIFKDLSYN